MEEENKKKAEFKPSLIPLHTPEKEYKQPIKRGGHLVRELNKYNDPNKGQLSIFDSLSSDTKNKIISSGVTIEHINKRGEATPFTKGHYKLIDCMSELLCEKSSSLNYEGNAKGNLVKYGEKQVQAPALALTLYEIAKKYNAGKNPSGKHIELVQKLLSDLEANPEYRVLIKHVRISKSKNGDTIKDTIEEFSPLLKILTASQETTKEATGKTSKKSEIIIMLNPIFNDQINSIWVEYPSNLVKRMIEAYGGANIGEATYKLRDYLAEKRSQKNFKIEVGITKLLYRVAQNYITKGRKSQALNALQKAIDTNIELGLLLSYKIAPAKNGEEKYIFEINKEWI